MSLTLELPPDVEKALAEEAAAKGTTPELLAVQKLQESCARPATRELTPDEGTLYDFLKPYIGVIDSSEYVPGGARMSEDTGRKFAEGMVKKRSERRL